ncbi:hypothetical protein CJU80_21210 [Pseudomonas fragi]|uniref:hypothetical protein n=1 Tax=Pseudomonas fragi TaxID=296 RepID=UPI000BA2B5FD|nr:hypothetical protein [Pseudomonas fragi]PAA35053.1 hypothetical protein CJU80_21210 [Pseudomonas fragi]
MKQPVEISAELTRQEAELLLAELRSRYGQVLNEVWYADPFRLIPEGLRHGSILMAMPVMAAQKRLMGALTHSLRAVK